MNTTRQLVKRYPIEDVLGWELYKESLRWALTDKAEEDLALPDDEDFNVNITIDGDDFVVTFA